ncbi:unnamed protein product, partial [Polarella glacialis]
TNRSSFSLWPWQGCPLGIAGSDALYLTLDIPNLWHQTSEGPGLASNSSSNSSNNNSNNNNNKNNNSSSNHRSNNNSNNREL